MPVGRWVSGLSKSTQFAADSLSLMAEGGGLQNPLCLDPRGVFFVLQ